MAGVGFELRKAVTGENKGEKITGYFGASFSSSGSMIVAIVIFALVQAAAKAQQASQAVNDSFMCYITNAMFLSCFRFSYCCRELRLWSLYLCLSCFWRCASAGY